MKPTSSFIFIAVYAIVFTCCQSQNEKNVPSLDVSVDYPNKEICLTDIAQVRYLYLNSGNSEFLYRGYIQAMSANRVVIADSRSGEIFIFSKDGDPISRFNNRGRGPGEYDYAHRVFYDEEADDLFIVEPAPKNIIHVYSSKGNHKRDITLPQETKFVNDIVSLDDESFLFLDNNPEYQAMKPLDAGGGIGVMVPVTEYAAPFYRISKKDGAVLDCVKLLIPPLFLGVNDNGIQIPGKKSRFLKSKEGAFICFPETDTVFMYNSKNGLTPVICKTPLASSMQPLIYLNNCVDKGKYQFMQTYTARREKGCFPFPTQYYMRNKETGEIVSQKFVLPHYKGKEFFIGPTEARVNGLENGVIFELKLLELKQANAQGKLSGKLKELVDTLKEDDNNIFVIAEF